MPNLREKRASRGDDSRTENAIAKASNCIYISEVEHCALQVWMNSTGPVELLVELRSTVSLEDIVEVGPASLTKNIRVVRRRTYTDGACGTTKGVAEVVSLE